MGRKGLSLINVEVGSAKVQLGLKNELGGTDIKRRMQRKQNKAA